MRWNGTALAVQPDGWLDNHGDAATHGHPGSSGAAAPTGSSLIGEELYDHTGDDGTDLDAFPLGHANLAGRPAMAAELRAHRATLVAFFRDGDQSVAFAGKC